MSVATTVVYWFRQDLRLADNPALSAAAKEGTVLPIYILDDVNAGPYAMGSASRVWLHHSLQVLNASLGGKLRFFVGDARKVLLELCQQHAVTGVYWNRCYEPWRQERDSAIKADLKMHKIDAFSFNASLLWEPWTVSKDDGSAYKVFTPFYRKGCLAATEPREPLPEPSTLSCTPTEKEPKGVTLESLGLLPKQPWGEELIKHWTVGEEGAKDRFDAFLEEGLGSYKEGRDKPGKPFVSRLSPYIHFGHISVHTIWQELKLRKPDKHTDHFCSELGWREFSYYLLYHNPSLPKVNIQAKFNAFPWQKNPALLRAWQLGKTGIPMVDAGMRQLYTMGYMHNRLRMIVGSFLVKNLRIDWREGERWFWDTLVDADLASNSASWQWVAGCGADAAPYFRIFNPVTQGKFDEGGEYVRRFVPELARLPERFLFCPWEAPLLVLKEAGVHLGVNYPNPIVDLKRSRDKALEAFAGLKVAKQ